MYVCRLAIVLFSFFSLACSDSLPQAELPPRPVAWVEVILAKPTSTRHFSALTRAQERTPLSFQVPGRVHNVLVDIGQPVKAGQAVAELDSKEYQLLVDQSQSSLVEAEIALQDARRNFNRQESMYQRKLVAVATLDDAKTALQQAQSRVDQLQAHLKRAQKQLDDTTLLAPYNGVISERDIEDGQQVSIGQKAFQLEGSGGMEVLFFVPEQLINQIDLGSKHMVSVPAAVSQSIPGQITEVGNHAQEAGAFPVVMKLIDPPQTIKTGMSAEALLAMQLNSLEGDSGSTESYTAIPLTAFLSEPNNGYAVYIFQSSTENGLVGSVSKTAIEIAVLTDQMALVSAGLAPGDIVVSQGVQQLRNQQEVVLLDPTTLRYNP